MYYKIPSILIVLTALAFAQSNSIFILTKTVIGPVEVQLCYEIPKSGQLISSDSIIQNLKTVHQLVKRVEFCPSAGAIGTCHYDQAVDHMKSVFYYHVVEPIGTPTESQQEHEKGYIAKMRASCARKGGQWTP